MSNWITPFYGTDIFDTFFDTGLRQTRQRSKTMVAANTYFSDNKYTIELVAPGYSREDFELNVDNGHFTIQVETSDGEDEKRELSTKEWHYASFKRSWSLPKNVNVDGISARYESGILYVTLPVEGEVNKKKSITVE